jgi:class 3 adenylate cyclase
MACLQSRDHQSSALGTRREDIECRLAPSWVPRRMTATRRLAAILAADVAGYSRLIGADEAGTLQAFKTIKAKVFDPTIGAHNGRLVKTTGDGFLVEFSSVVDALRCATEVQVQMAERNATVPTVCRSSR